MNPKVLEALDESIAKWEEAQSMLESLRGQAVYSVGPSDDFGHVYISHSSGSCPLCQIFHCESCYTEDYGYCPLAVRMETGCRGTPYLQWCALTGNIVDDDMIASHFEMVTFMKGIRDAQTAEGC